MTRSMRIGERRGQEALETGGTLVPAVQKGQMFLIGSIMVLIGLIMLKNLLAVYTTVEETRFQETNIIDKQLSNVVNEYENIIGLASLNGYDNGVSYLSNFSGFLRNDIDSEILYSFVFANGTTQRYNVTIGNYLGDKINLTVNVTDSVIYDKDASLVMPLDNDTLDYSDYDNDGTNNGANCSVSGKYGTACEFDGVGDHINLGTSVSFISDMTGTIEFWVKPNDISTEQSIFEVDGTVYLIFEVRNNGFKIDHGSNQVVINVTLTAGNWYHVVWTSDGSTWRGYLNGVEKTLLVSGSNNGDWFGDVSSPTYVQFGKHGASGLYFNGSIDEVAIYNRSLSAEEIWEDYMSSYKSRFFALDDKTNVTRTFKAVKNTTVNMTIEYLRQDNKIKEFVPFMVSTKNLVTGFFDVKLKSSDITVRVKDVYNRTW